MTTLVHRVQRSLFFRLSLIFGITVVLFLVIISLSLRSMNQSANVIETIPDFFTRNIESIIEDIGTPPNLSNAMRLADELDWSIRIHNPIMRWSSDNDYRLNVEESEFSERLSGDAEMRSVNNEDIILVQRGGYDFYLYQRFGSENLFSTVSIYIGLTLAAFVLFLNYFMVNKLL